MIEIKPGHYFLALWTLGDGSTRDWLCAAWKDGEVWTIRYRFRYYKDSKLGPESKDDRNWYDVELKPGMLEAEAEKIGDDLQRLLEKTSFGVNPEKLAVRSDDFEIVTRALQEHAKTSLYLHVEERMLH